MAKKTKKSLLLNPPPKEVSVLGAAGKGALMFLGVAGAIGLGAVVLMKAGGTH